MRLRFITVAAVLLTVISSIGISRPAAAKSTHTVVISGHFSVFGDSHFGHSTEISGDFESPPTELTHNGVTDMNLRLVRCAGEARGELLITVHLIDATDEFVADARLDLYEESDCGGNDLEAPGVKWKRRIPAGEQRSAHLFKPNGEFLSFDSVEATFTVKNGVQPSDPNHVVATRVFRRLYAGRTALIHWQDMSNNETGYEIRNSTTGTVNRVGPNITEFEWHGLNPRIDHCFQVRAIGEFGTSNWSPPGREDNCVAAN